VTLPLTPDTLRAAYDFLNSTPPFNRWNLPDGEDVIFKVVRDRTYQGWYRKIGKRHAIGISRHFIGQTDPLIRVMGHEMVHLHEEHARALGRGEHSAAFRKWADQVCRIHGFDPKLF